MGSVVGGKEKKVAVTVLLAEAGERGVEKAVDRLRAAGLEVEGVQAALGTVTGQVARGKLKALSKVSGVEAVEEAETYQIPPPESPTQ